MDVDVGEANSGEILDKAVDHGLGVGVERDDELVDFVGANSVVALGKDARDAPH